MNAVDLMGELDYPTTITTLARWLAEEAIVLAALQDILLAERIDQAA